ncbi:MAG: hypothetical protein V4611_01150 [Patescibacteria group bacterium]
MDVVYVVKYDPENNSEELRYSLRSLKNLPHGNVVIVGEKPDWVTNVTYIPVAQTKTKRENVTMNLLAAINSELVSDDFMLMNDDFFIMKELSEMPILNFGPLADVIAYYNHRYPEGSEYISNMTKLYNLLIERGNERPMSYELHTPMILNKKNVQSLYTEPKEPFYQFRTYYGNFFNIGGTSVRDVKVFTEPQHNDARYNSNPREYLEGQTFLSVTGGSFKRGVPGDFVREKLNEKSIYEL